MAQRTVGFCILIAVVLTAGAAASGERDVVPRFSLDATAATVGDQVVLRVERALHLREREIRLYLVPTGIAVRTRFDSRLHFIGTIRTSQRARLLFTVPPLEPGGYSLAYWCPECFPAGQAIGIQAAPKMRINAEAREGCPTTKPNRRVPKRVAIPSGFLWHGNGGLWAFFRPDGSLITNRLGGYKMLWIARDGTGGRLRVQYRMIDPPSSPLIARTGWLSEYERPNATMSQMHFDPGCWQITGRVGDLSLSFVVQVERGTT